MARKSTAKATVAVVAPVEAPEQTETATPKPKKTKAPAELHNCACGCGESVERVFRQGHDQRLISILADETVNGGRCRNILGVTEAKNLDIQDKINKVSAYVADKLSGALATKYENAASRAWELDKNRDEREAAKAARKAEAAAKPKRTRKAAAPSEEAGVAAPARPLSIVKPTATNEDVDADETAQDNGALRLGAPVRVKLGNAKRIRNATVTGMNQAGKVTAITVMNGTRETVKTDGFEVVTD